jgi:hypothetical protein
VPRHSYRQRCRASRSLRGQLRGVGSVSIAWTEADGNGLPITGWRVARDGVDTSGTGAWSTVLPKAATQFTFQSLQPDAGYNVLVQAITAAGTGPAARQTLVENDISSRQSCDSPGTLNGSFYGASRCDGFWWVGVGSLGAYNVTASRTTGGIVLSYTLGSASTASAYDAEGTVSQLDSRKFPRQAEVHRERYSGRRDRARDRGFPFRSCHAADLRYRKRPWRSLHVRQEHRDQHHLTDGANIVPLRQWVADEILIPTGSGSA